MVVERAADGICDSFDVSLSLVWLFRDRRGFIENGTTAADQIREHAQFQVHSKPFLASDLISFRFSFPFSVFACEANRSAAIAMTITVYVHAFLLPDPLTAAQPHTPGTDFPSVAG